MKKFNYVVKMQHINLNPLNINFHLKEKQKNHI